ncbi:MAG: UDP-3-O-(3-hydroxymyristoyl)glucosamine N-acyltransferase [Bacteroidia bacterium]|nr:UDP-3-O-(3-hydroxymyristoyl)glucosamine N-acyltransferase [Bacteroidia bacterium]MDW8346657.1 UDP-3-O-(3-hydroxymyristoyl)glucosamine N-acyltransferase [Bacteroidia bacterium]
MKLSKSVTVKELAALLKTTYIGDPDQEVLGFNEIHKVEPGDVTFVDVEKYYSKALNSPATIIIINKAIECPKGKSLILSEDPFRDYNFCTEYFQPRLPMARQGMSFEQGKNVRLSTNVVIGEGTFIGDNTEIGANVVIGNHVKIGANCVIYPNVVIYDYTEIGNFVTINAGTVIGGEAFYFKRRPERFDKMLSKGNVVIEDYVEIGCNCTIDRGVSATTRIGAHTIMDNLIQIGHDTVIGKRCLIASQVGIAGVVEIEDDVIIWGQVGINKDLRIGKKAVLLGKTGVMSSLEGNKTYLGMIAQEAKQTLREVAATKKLPEMLLEWEKKKKNM